MTIANGTAIVPAQEAPPKTPLAIGTRGVQLQTMEDMYRFSRAVVAAGLAPQSLSTPEAVMIAIQLGAEIGIPPMAAVRSIYVVNNRPTLWGDMMLGLCKAHTSFDHTRFAEWVVGEGDSMVAHCKCARRGGNEATQSFSVTDARNAGLLGKNLYKSYLRRMLQMRARALSLRDMFPDVLQGIYAHEELDADGETPYPSDNEQVVRRTAPKPEPRRSSAAAEINAALQQTTQSVVRDADVTDAEPPAEQGGGELAPGDADDADLAEALHSAMEAVRIWAEAGGRPIPSDEEILAGLKRFATALKLGQLADIVADLDRLDRFLASARSSSVAWAKYLRAV